ncbi:MAG: 4-alpha-glucanotransferase [Mariprofundaceae bacterium]|nr:4-alpha-glucanotransferase [Mariprofundaceae bacterium]
MTSCLKQRRSGVLLHITSLPGPFKHGVLGEEARQFVDQIIAGGYRIWQFLPLGPTHSHGSPYESLSSSAGNPDLIDLRQTVQKNWLTESDIEAIIQGNLVLATARAKAALHFWQEAEDNAALREKINLFRQENKDWLEDYALFASLKVVHEGMAWWDWPQALRDRQFKALKEASHTLLAHIHQVIFEQFLFAEQWQAIKAYAESRDVQLFGDLPIYVAHDSSDVWANRDFFTVNEEGLCDQVAGVPPDYFSETGQRWGNPLYLWDKMQDSGFSWWIERVRVQIKRMHMLRIDHFRGLEAYWAIPGHREDGIEGVWRKAPGDELLQALQDTFGQLPLIAEDLGMITEEVHVLRKKFNLPGMKILQFAFGGGADNPYLPHQHSYDMVTYTGTHDNDTTMGWWQAASDGERQHLLAYLGITAEDMPWPVIRAALASPAILAIIPMQDLLELDTSARFNTPGTLKNNWCWRMQKMPNMDDACWTQSKPLNEMYGRS